MLKSPWKGKRFQTVNEIKEKVLAAFWAVGEMLGELCEVPSCLLWRGLRRHYPMYKVSCILFNKCLFFALHGWILSGQTLYKSFIMTPSTFEKIDWKLVSNKSDYIYSFGALVIFLTSLCYESREACLHEECSVWSQTGMSWISWYGKQLLQNERNIRLSYIIILFKPSKTVSAFPSGFTEMFPTFVWVYSLKRFSWNLCWLVGKEEFTFFLVYLITWKEPKHIYSI